MTTNKKLYLVFFLMGTVLFACMCATFFAFMKLETLHRAARTDDADMIQRLLDQDKSQLEYRNRLQETPLHSAAYGGHCNAIRALVKNGADVNAWWPGAKSPDESYNPLHITAINGRLEAAKLLVEAGTDLNALSIRGKTPLDVAIQNGHRQLAELFRSKGGCTGDEIRQIGKQ